MVTIKKILCPIDFSKPSYVALEAANGLALQYSSELYLLNVASPIPTTVPIEQFNYEMYEGKQIEEAKRLLQKVIEERVSKKVRVHAIVVPGDAQEEIVKIAAKDHVDVIVIATHGRTGWKHIIFGSVTEKVIRLAPCPVLVIRAPHKKGNQDKVNASASQHE